ncbi:MAG: ankyrin repeat domain-containing protein [Planctomycetes bacterium]|nr:ankyrin repeat domain-containing protein [Planctomycetota bacterium]
MSERIPLALFVTRRANCPSCGALLEFAGQAGQVACAFCGCSAVVERRLRYLEAEVVDQRRVEVDWTPAHLNPGTPDERAACPGCGAGLAIDAVQSHARCSHCDCQVKIERRIRRVALALAPSAEGEDARVVELIETLRRSQDRVERLELAERLDRWGAINPTLARRVVEVMQLQRESDPLLGQALGGCLGKLLCQGDAVLRDAVVQAAQGFLGDPQGSPALIWQLGLGSGVCLKPLLDAADALAQAGALRLACTALWAANTLLGRNYPEHPVLSEVILYRVIYLHGVPLAWALEFVSGRGAVRFEYPVETLLRFLDDCSAERPELVEEVQQAVRSEACANETDYGARLDLFSTLHSAPARETLLRTLEPPPAGTSLRMVRRAVDLCAGLLADATLGDAAAAALVRLCDGPAGATPLAALVRAEGDALPEPVRRAFLKSVPDSPLLSPLPPRRWSSPPKHQRAPWLEALHAEYKREFSAAVDAYRATSAALQALRAQSAGHTPLMVAARRGELELVEQLLAAGAEVDARSPFGRTALMVAAQAGQTEVVAALLRAGASVDLRDKERQSALTLAAAAGQAAALWAVFAEGDSTPEARQEAFRAAFAAAQWPLVRALLAAGADPDTLEADGATPLILACRAGDLEGAQVLIEAGALLDHCDRRGQTPRMAAEAAGAAALVELLTRAGG